jgi:hypothetical protein
VVESLGNGVEIRVVAGVTGEVEIFDRNGDSRDSDYEIWEYDWNGFARRDTTTVTN